jgi:murein L,D-transpeptidase YafK
MKRTLQIYILFLSFSFSCTANSAEFFPENLIQLDAHFSHHVVIAEKSTHQLYLYEYEEGFPRVIKTFQMATGKIKGDKQYSGDHKTPEGVYTLRSFIPQKKLLKRYGKEGEIYGVGAFILDYPNSIDIIKKKTGGGIWLHSTNDETRIAKGLDSRGCVVIANDHLKEISAYLEMNKTTFIIVDKISYLKKDLWLKERMAIKTKLQRWLDAWKKEDLTNYISHYSKDLFHSKFKGNFSKYKRYKKSVFWQKGSPDISIGNVSIFKHKDYVRVRFVQDYKSSKINDTGLKTLYLKIDKQYQWKIVRELWSKLDSTSKQQNRMNNIFKPSMRFFTTASTPGHINE